MVGFCVLVGLVAACSSAPLAECRLRALAPLQEEPEELTLGDLRAVKQALRACNASPDGGVR